MRIGARVSMTADPPSDNITLAAKVCHRDASNSVLKRHHYAAIVPLSVYKIWTRIFQAVACTVEGALAWPTITASGTTSPMELGAATGSIFS